jgi:hypothetical protein
MTIEWFSCVVIIGILRLRPGQNARPSKNSIGQFALINNRIDQSLAKLFNVCGHNKATVTPAARASPLASGRICFANQAPADAGVDPAALKLVPDKSDP